MRTRSISATAGDGRDEASDVGLETGVGKDMALRQGSVQTKP